MFFLSKNEIQNHPCFISIQFVCIVNKKQICCVDNQSKLYNCCSPNVVWKKMKLYSNLVCDDNPPVRINSSLTTRPDYKFTFNEKILKTLILPNLVKHISSEGYNSFVDLDRNCKLSREEINTRGDGLLFCIFNLEFTYIFLVLGGKNS